MLQTYGQYNVGVLVVRGFQLYSLSKIYPDKCGHIHFANFILNLLPTGDSTFFELFDKRTRSPLQFDEDVDLPTRIAFNVGTKDPSDIVLMWTKEARKDKLWKLMLNEDTGVITAHFYGNGKDVLKSSDGRVEYLVNLTANRPRNDPGTIYIANRVKHRPQNEGPAVITAEGDKEYWENGEHIRTKYLGREQNKHFMRSAFYS